MHRAPSARLSPVLSRRELLAACQAATALVGARPLRVTAQDPSPSAAPSASVAPPVTPSTPAGTPEPTPPSGTPRVALLITRTAGDLGAVDDMIAALERTEADLGVATSVVVVTDPGGAAAAIRRLAQAGNDIVAVTWDAVDMALASVAADFPDQRFIGIAGGPITPVLPNVATVSFDTHEACHLAGILAANATYTRQLGVVGGVAGPRPHADANAFAAAARTVDVTIVVTTTFAGTTEDRLAGRTVATDLVAAGADILLTDAGATDLGAIEVAQETGTFVIGGGEAVVELAPATVIATLAVLHGQALYEQIRAALDPGFAGGHQRSGIADGMVDLLISDRFLAEGPQEMVGSVGYAVPEMEAAREAIIAGTLVPPFDTLPPA